MSTDFYIKLTLAVYKVTELFPKDESLKRNIRDLANEILTALINKQGEDISRLIEDLNNLFDSAQAQNLVDSRNFLVLRREYAKIENSAKKQAKTLSGKTVEKPRTTQNRKQEILRILQEKKKIQLRELTQTFPQVSKRTLMRDLEEFYQSGIVVRVGNGRASCYNIKQ